MKRCYECKYLSDKRCSIGRLCTADKPWRRDISRWKVQSEKACKYFEPNGLKWEDHMMEAANVKAGKKTEDIVRCGECVWLYLHDGHTGVCENRFGLNGVVKPDDYCSKGKKREKQIPERTD